VTTTQLKELHQAKPFKPFDIHVSDGDVLRISHPELLWLHPGGRTVFVARGPRDEDGTAIVDLLLVTKLVTSSGADKGQGDRKGSNGA
jgi:hypothetical protein